MFKYTHLSYKKTAILEWNLIIRSLLFFLPLALMPFANFRAAEASFGQSSSGEMSKFSLFLEENERQLDAIMVRSRRIQQPKACSQVLR